MTPLVCTHRRILSVALPGWVGWFVAAPLAVLQAVLKIQGWNLVICPPRY